MQQQFQALNEEFVGVANTSLIDFRFCESLTRYFDTSKDSEVFFTFHDFGFIANNCCLGLHNFANTNFSLLSSYKLSKSLESFSIEFGSNFVLLKFSNFGSTLLCTTFWVFCRTCTFRFRFGILWEL